jgi:hypothetical protein
MIRPDTAREITMPGWRTPVLAIVLVLLAGPARAEDAARAAADPLAMPAIELLSPRSLDPALTAAVLPDGDFSLAAAEDVAPAQELATGLGLQVQKKRRKFRQRAVNWMGDRSVAVGRMTDFLLGGADSGWHLVVDPTGTDEYVLEWKARFR